MVLRPRAGAQARVPPCQAWAGLDRAVRPAACWRQELIPLSCPDLLCRPGALHRLRPRLRHYSPLRVPAPPFGGVQLAQLTCTALLCPPICLFCSGSWTRSRLTATWSWWARTATWAAPSPRWVGAPPRRRAGAAEGRGQMAVRSSSMGGAGAGSICRPCQCHELQNVQPAPANCRRGCRSRRLHPPLLLPGAP